MKTYKKLFGEAAKVRHALYWTVGLRLFSGVILVLQAYVLSMVIADVFIGGETLSSVQGLVFIFVGLVTLRAILTGISEMTAYQLAGTIKHDLRQRFFGHLSALGPAYIRGERSGELVSTATEGIEALDAYFRKYLPQISLSAFIPLAILIFVFPVDILSALIFLLTAPFILFLMMLIGRWADQRAKEQFKSLSYMSAHFLDVLQGLTTLKIFGRSTDQREKISDVSDKFRQTTLSVVSIAFLSALFLEMLSTISIAIVAVEIGLRLLHGNMIFQEALFVLIIAPEFYQPLRSLGASFHDGVNGVAAAVRIYEVLEIPLPTVHPDDQPWRDLPDGALNIRFADVGFTYPHQERPALEHISFEIRAGQKVALVGASGAGKSTLSYLLLSFLNPTTGSIQVQDIPITQIKRGAWWHKIGWVQQHSHLFYGTVAENIRLGRPDATMDEVIWAATQANIHEEIVQFAQGYDTLIGERGARLSGGQSQRLALARLFLKDAPIIILDEATAHLDPENESLVKQALHRLLKNRTVLMIAHRLNTVYDADHIVVLSKGHIIEQGTHQQLLSANGMYSMMVNAYGGAS